MIIKYIIIWMFPMLFSKYQDSLSVGFGGNLAKKSQECQNAFLSIFWSIHWYTDISIEPKIPVFDICHIPVCSTTTKHVLLEGCFVKTEAIYSIWFMPPECLLLLTHPIVLLHNLRGVLHVGLAAVLLVVVLVQTITAPGINQSNTFFSMFYYLFCLIYLSFCVCVTPFTLVKYIRRISYTCFLVLIYNLFTGRFLP